MTHIIVNELAAHAHTAWLKAFVSQNDPAPTRIKPCSCATCPHPTFNIAVPWDDIPSPCWKLAQYATFQKYVNALLITQKPQTLEQYAHIVHTVWMAENDFQRLMQPHLFVDYTALAENDKQKDRDIALIIIASLHHPI